MTKISQDINYPKALFPKSFDRSMADDIEDKKNALFDKDMRWTRIHEMIKMRAPISISDKDYYLDKLMRFLGLAIK